MCPPGVSRPGDSGPRFNPPLVKTPATPLSQLKKNEPRKPAPDVAGIQRVTPAPEMNIGRQVTGQASKGALQQATKDSRSTKSAVQKKADKKDKRKDKTATTKTGR
jgi:hypothetical protein